MEELLNKEGFVSIGKIIGEIRTAQDITVADLSDGLCSRQFLELLEAGKTDADIRLLQILLSRLGKSPNKLDYIVPQYQYDQLELQLRFNDSLDAEDAAGANVCLETMKHEELLDEKLRELFYLRNLSSYRYRIDHDYNGAFWAISKCLDISVPKWNFESIEQRNVSTFEIENLMAYIYFGVRSDNIARKKLECQNATDLPEVLSVLNTLIEKKVIDDEERANIVPKYCWLAAYILSAEGQKANGVREAEKGVMLLRKHALLNFMFPLLEIILKYGEGITTLDTFENYREYYTALDSIIEETNANALRAKNWFVNCNRATHHLDWELIKTQRSIKGYKRVEFIENIYKNVETLSRVETGKAAPNKTTFPKMMNKLGLDRPRYGSSMVCYRFEQLELLHKMILHLIGGEIQEATVCLNNLKASVDLRYRRNQKILAYFQDTIELKTKAQGPKQDYVRICQEVLKRNTEYLSETYPVFSQSVKRMPLPDEAAAINNIILCHYGLEDMEEILGVLKDIVSAYEKSAVDERLNCRWYGLFLTTCSQLTHDLDGTKKSLDFHLKVLSMDDLERVLANLAVLAYFRDGDADKALIDLGKSMAIAKLVFSSEGEKNGKYYITKIQEQSIKY